MMIKPEDKIFIQIKEINETLSELKKQETRLDDIVNKKIDESLARKIEEYKIPQTVDEYKKENISFVNQLRENLLAKYYDFIQDRTRVLEEAKHRLQSIIISSS